MIAPCHPKIRHCIPLGALSFDQHDIVYFNLGMTKSTKFKLKKKIRNYGSKTSKSKDSSLKVRCGSTADKRH